MYRAIVTGVLDVFLPDLCRCCGAPVEREGGETGICQQCLVQVVYIDRDRWCRCGRTHFAAGSAHTTLCGKCIQQPAAYDSFASLCEYEGPVRGLLHRLKYQADTSVMPALASIIARSPYLLDIECDLVIPVPLHRLRLQNRGLNQSLYLAKLFFKKYTGKISPYYLQRHMNTPPQTGLQLHERRKNLRNVFSLKEDAGIKGQKICLVDDVFTSGATIHECSKVLKQAGALQVTAVTLAMTIRADQRLV